MVSARLYYTVLCVAQFLAFFKWVTWRERCDF